jgi:hypothetical protein
MFWPTLISPPTSSDSRDSRRTSCPEAQKSIVGWKPIRRKDFSRENSVIGRCLAESHVTL